MEAETIELVLTPDGEALTYWWTEEAGEILGTLGPPAPEYENVNDNRWCG